MKWARLIAWLAVLGLVAALGWRYLADQTPPPTQALPALQMQSLEARAGFEPDEVEGVWLLNVWGSWCAPCHAEHPVLMALRREGIAIYGLNWRDAPEDAQQFLDDLGNPFVGVMQDIDNASVTALGINGAPETLVIKDGEIYARWPGPLTSDALRNEIYPALDRASRD